jgi:hypothetical protein
VTNAVRPLRSKRGLGTGITQEMAHARRHGSTNRDMEVLLARTMQLNVADDVRCSLV